MPLNQEVGLFVPTTNVWDVGPIYQANIDNPELVELLVRLYQNINNIAIALNLKDSGMYYPFEFINGQTFFPNPNNSSATQINPSQRQVYRQLVVFGALPNSGTKSMPHGIIVSSMTTFTRVYATASDTTGFTYIPIPYVDTGGSNIALNVDATNVNITTTSNRTNFNVCYVVLEYLQQ
jgi:hypothetical protein